MFLLIGWVIIMMLVNCNLIHIHLIIQHDITHIFYINKNKEIIRMFYF
jgi:hypothetical protein